MKRNSWNILIDAFSLIVFMLMISTGLLMKFILPPGSGRVDRLMRGGGRVERTIDVCLGLTRHEWGQIHLYISIGFLVLLTVHLFLHWKWIKSAIIGSVPKPPSFTRKVMVICIVTIIILTLLFPWIAPKQTLTRSEFLELRSTLQ